MGYLFLPTHEFEHVIIKFNINVQIILNKYPLNFWLIFGHCTISLLFFDLCLNFKLKSERANKNGQCGFVLHYTRCINLFSDELVARGKKKNQNHRIINPHTFVTIPIYNMYPVWSNTHRLPFIVCNSFAVYFFIFYFQSDFHCIRIKRSSIIPRHKRASIFSNYIIIWRTGTRDLNECVLIQKKKTVFI